METKKVTWNVAKKSIHDASGIDKPENWLWERDNGIYYPVQEINFGF
jgi:hypothetical protein